MTTTCHLRIYSCVGCFIQKKKNLRIIFRQTTAYHAMFINRKTNALEQNKNKNKHILWSVIVWNRLCIIMCLISRSNTMCKCCYYWIFISPIRFRWKRLSDERKWQVIIFLFSHLWERQIQPTVSTSIHKHLLFNRSRIRQH